MRTKVRLQFELSAAEAKEINRLTEETGYTTLAELCRAAIGWYGDTLILAERYGNPCFVKSESIDPERDVRFIPVGIFPGLTVRWDALKELVEQDHSYGARDR